MFEFECVNGYHTSALAGLFLILWPVVRISYGFMAAHGVSIVVPMVSCCADLEGLPPALEQVYLNDGRERGGPCRTSATSATQCRIMPVALSL